MPRIKIRLTQKSTAASKRPKRRGSDSTSAGLSDDEGYSGLEDVSDSEDDEVNVEAAEEKHIVARNRRSNGYARSSPRPLRSDTLEEDGADDEDEGDDTSAEDNDSQVYDSGDEGNDEEEDDVSENDSDIGYNAFVEQEPPAEEVSFAPRERRVRFTGIPDSDSDSTDTDSDAGGEYLTDLFVSQDSLDSNFRRQIEQDHDDYEDNAGEWLSYQEHMSRDILGDYSLSQAPAGSVVSTPLDTPVRSTFGDSAPPTASSSPIKTPAEYSSDEDQAGDTTDEDEYVPLPRKTTPMTPPPPPRESSQTVTPSNKKKTRSPRRTPRDTPRSGTFKLDGSSKKPVCILNPNSRKMMIFTPQDTRHHDLSPEQFNIDFLTTLSNANSFASAFKTLPSLASNMMVAGSETAHWPNLDMPAEYTAGPFNDFTLLDGGVGAFAQGEQDAEESNLDISDFITFHDEESSEDDEEGGGQVKDSAMSSPTKSSFVEESEFEGFDSAAPSSPIKAVQPSAIPGLGLQQVVFAPVPDIDMDSSSPSEDAASPRLPVTPTPLKRRYSNQMPPPSALDTLAMKRKFSIPANDGVHLHKRQRSISDVKTMRI